MLGIGDNDIYRVYHVLDSFCNDVSQNDDVGSELEVLRESHLH